MCVGRHVRFERTAEFLAVCASGDTDEAQDMLKEVQLLSNGDKTSEEDTVNSSNADGITALHQVRGLSVCLVCVWGSIALPMLHNCFIPFDSRKKNQILLGQKGL